MIVDYKKKAQYNNLVGGLDVTSINTDNVNLYLQKQQQKSVAGTLLQDIERHEKRERRRERSIERSRSRELIKQGSKITRGRSSCSRGSLSISPTSRDSHRSKDFNERARLSKKVTRVRHRTSSMSSSDGKSNSRSRSHSKNRTMKTLSQKSAQKKQKMRSPNAPSRYKQGFDVSQLASITDSHDPYEGVIH